MNRSLTIARTAVLTLALAVSAMLPSAGRAASGDAKGIIIHKARTVTLAHAYLVTGPDGLDPKKTVGASFSPRRTSVRSCALARR